MPNHNDIMTEGYVGVSNNPKRRFSEHKNNSSLRKDKNPFFSRALKKYSDKIIQTIIFQGTKEACYKLEEEIRPTNNIGWNANKGGLNPPNKLGWKPSELTIQKRSLSLTGIPRTEQWRKNLSNSKKGSNNGMYGKKYPCSIEKKISIIVTKHKDRVNQIIEVFQYLSEKRRIRDIAKITGYSTATVMAIKKNSELYIRAFPILKQFKTC